jgi:hypothetical protein
VAGCITGLLLRDAESLKGLPDLRAIIDRKDKLPPQVFQNPAELLKVIPRKDPVPVIVLAPIIRKTNILFTK